MKIPELYITDILILIDALNTKGDSVAKLVEQRAKECRREMFWMPWRKKYAAPAFLTYADSATSFIKQLEEITAKLMESTGVDEDMRPVTLDEMIKRKKAQVDSNS